MSTVLSPLPCPKQLAFKNEAPLRMAVLPSHFGSRDWRPVLVCILAVVVLLASHTWAAGFDAAAAVLDARCTSCHGSDAKEGGIDLRPLLLQKNASYGKHTGLWSKVESMVAQGEMPPDTEASLKPAEKEAILAWFRESFVLREGKPHIGPTPLRRLTRYELENTLEDVLSIKLKAPYHDMITGHMDRSKIESIVPSDIPGESGFANDAHRMGKLKPPLKQIAEAVHYAVLEFSKDPAAQKRVLGEHHDVFAADTDVTEIKQAISKFLQRSYRGQDAAASHYMDSYFEVFQKHFRGSHDAGESLLHVLEMILVSPEFLYRLEESKDQDTPYPVSGVELATRLSYFLWSTSPDEELVRLGRDGSLLEDEVLKSQVDRMLNSPKRLSLSKNFAGQWLGFDELLSNSEYFVDERWNRETYDEALFFFDELIRADKSVLEIVQSDWIYKRSAAVATRARKQPQPQQPGYTRIDPKSVKYRRADILSDRKSKSRDKRARYDPPVLVQTKDDREGGLITSPAIMRLTASKSRTSPIRRGVWVLSTVIGRQLEPPPDVPSLEEAREALNLKRNPSVAEVIKQHVSKPECVSCHKAIDPLGLGLENYAPDGSWRTSYPDKAPVEASGAMPNGKLFKSPWEMKQLLLELYADDIAKNFAEEMFAYALGRKLEPYDRVSLDRIVAKVKEEDYRIGTVIEQIVLSPQFRRRQDR